MVAQEPGGAGSALLPLAVMLPAGADSARQDQLAVLAARLGYVAVHLPVAAGETVPADRLARLREVAAPARVVPDDGRDSAHLVRGRDLAAVRRARVALDAAGDTGPVIVAVPVAIGRTRNEAVARAARDPRFTGADHPEHSGIFGTLEQAQAQVLELAAAGAGGLLVTVADELDVADLLAQVRSLVVGPAVVLGRAPA